MPWILFIILFIVARSAEYLYTKKLLKNDSPLVFSFIRTIFGLGFVIIMSFFIDLTIDIISLLLIFLISLFATAGVYYRNKSFQKFEVSYVTPMLNLIPFFVFIFALIFLGDSLTLFKAIGILLVTLSLYALNLSKEKNLLSPFIDFIKHKKFLVILPIIFFSVTAILDKYTLFSVNPLTFIFYLSIFFTINFLILITFTKKIPQVKKSISLNFKHYLIIGALLIISQVGQYYATSLKEISLVNPLLMSSSLVVIMFSGKIFNETNIPRKLFSTTILIIGIILILT